MRYLGNKESILNNIIEVLEKKNLLSKRYVFFDAFCGSGTVSNGVKNYFDLILNDNLLMALDFTRGRIVSQLCKFDRLGFNPVDYFNSNEIIEEGFFSKNYSPKLSGRMYFSDFNAGRIDYFRNQIERWKNDNLINDDEYVYLIGCLLESISKVANIAGVYGAYLKKWDPRATKKIKFINIETFESVNEPKIRKYYNNNLSEIISNVDCDILYLDPPYTKNKYSVQYHLLETLVRNDNPILKGITGTRDMPWVSNSWSTHNQVEIEFDNTIANTKAKYIIMSYSSDGLMSKDFILNILKRYCIEDSIEFIEINYKKYRNSKTFTTNEHYEYIIYAEKKNKKDIEYYCPLNYMGGKTNVIEFIKPELSNKNKFIDLMGGGFNVGINAFSFNDFVYNDVNHIVKDMIIMFKNENTKIILDSIEKIIKKYDLGKHKKQEYIKYRDDYNKVFRFKTDYTIYLFTLILFGFQQQLRFNSKHEFNNPIGESGYNESIKEKIVSFSRRIKEMKVEFYSCDFQKMETIIDHDTLVYIDPPYLITLGSYNDGKRGFNGWTENDELRLIDFINAAKSKGSKIVISNILDYKGKSNDILKKWVNSNKTKIYNINIRGRKEVLIVYES